MKLIKAWLYAEQIKRMFAENIDVPYLPPAFKPTVYPLAKGFPDATNSRLKIYPLAKIYPERLVFAVAKVDKIKGLVDHGEVYISAEKVKNALATKANTTPAALHGMLKAALKNIAHIKTPGNDSPTQKGTIDVYCHIKGSTQLRKLVIATQGQRKNQILSLSKTTPQKPQDHTRNSP